MASDKRHKPEYTQNLDDTWNYKCGCGGDKKTNMKSKATGVLAFRSHVASTKSRIR